MLTLKFDEGICKKCETYDCIMKCQYMDMDLEKAKEEKWKLIRSEDSSILKDCATCYACEEYCPHGNHPFYLIVERQEEKGYHPVPKPIEKVQLRMMEPAGIIDYKEVKEPVLDLCVFAMMEGAIRGKLFKDVSIISGNDLFCQLMFLHFAKHSTIKEKLPKMIDNIMTYYLKGNNIKELVCYHDECYGAYTSWAKAFGVDVPFKPVHLFDFLCQRLEELKSDIKPLNLKVAYQRPCSNRLIPETDHFVDDIFKLIGVERAKREYDHEDALCCGGIMEIQQLFDLVEENQEKNVDDMKASGATHCVFNCPFCFFILAEKVGKSGIVPIMMSDLCLQALGE
ncbi:MAG: (Fe-S)-binding protein [Thermodesulfobacteriota bacterium]|nr:(Fe-S)-binding protein [Thermodesulfobacteriota bacterium]